MIKRKKRKEKKRKGRFTQKFSRQGVFCNAAVLGYNTDVLIVLKGFFSSQNVSKHFFSIYF